MIKRNNEVIVPKEKFCNSLISKALGLRFRKKPVNNAFIFSFDTPQTILMDMWFVFYPIDVVFLDNDKKIVEVKEKFLPFSFYKSHKKARYIIEFESGTVKKCDINIGNRLIF
jgi:uncharacterized protein